MCVPNGKRKILRLVERRGRKSWLHVCRQVFGDVRFQRDIHHRQSFSAVYSAPAVRPRALVPPASTAQRTSPLPLPSATKFSINKRRLLALQHVRGNLCRLCLSVSGSPYTLRLRPPQARGCQTCQCHTARWPYHRGSPSRHSRPRPVRPRRSAQKKFPRPGHAEKLPSAP